MNSKKFKAIISLTLVMVMNNALASKMGITHENYSLDVFKSDQVTVAEIDKKYGNDLKEIAAIMLNANSMAALHNSKRLNELFEKVMKGIHDTGDYAYFGFSPITYPGVKKIGFSVDLVDKKDSQRIDGFKPNPSGNIIDPHHLIADWLKYEEFGFDQFFKKNKPLTFKECPAFHCLFGFEDPALKYYGDKFNTEVPKYKKELLAILQKDKNEIKRGAAAYLLAHLKDGNEVVKILTPSMRDASSLVRNNVMRVLAATTAKLTKVDFPMSELQRALRYPSTVDRNKALYLATSLVKQPRYADYIKEHACSALLEQFNLVQPNLHDTAYEVLTTISHEKYSREDYPAWKNWADKNCKSV